MFSGRHELVRHEQNKDACRQAEAQRLAKQLPESDARFASLANWFAQLRSRLFPARRRQAAQKQMPELKQKEVLAAQE